MNDEDRELLVGIYIQLSRVLDALYVLAGPEGGKKLDSIHRAGGLISSEPFLVGEESAPEQDRDSTDT